LTFICNTDIIVKKGGESMENYGTKEASEILGLAQSTISKKCREGVFPGAEQDAKNSPWRIPKEDIEKYLEKPMIGEKT
jgi:excisionase family DNA binding protein